MHHHDETLAAFAARSRTDAEALGLILLGSVARGEERPDSDVDVSLVVTEEAFQQARREGRLSYVDTEVATYPGGYVDVKVIGPSWLAAAAEHADEPTRSSLRGARVVWTSLPELPSILAEAAAPSSDDVWRERLVTATARMRLQCMYFLVQGVALEDPFLTHAAATEFVRAAGQAMLAHAHVLYAGPKYLRSAVQALPETPADLVPAFDELLRTPDPDRAQEIMMSVEQIIRAPLSAEATLGRFVADNELAWLWAAGSDAHRA
jgi:hypothetical protein